MQFFHCCLLSPSGRASVISWPCKQLRLAEKCTHSICFRLRIVFTLPRLHRVHELHGCCYRCARCLSVCHAAHLGFTLRGSFGAVFAKSLWPLVVSRSLAAWTWIAVKSRSDAVHLLFHSPDCRRVCGSAGRFGRRQRRFDSPEFQFDSTHCCYVSRSFIN